ncbi:MAG TPA: NUDIX domain-containing protein, partial [Gemmatimonadales bacterium]|nr:NUDIX domain-containing protein [Gemmatimonadales bacterium]
MTTFRVAFVDTYVLRTGPAGLEVLVLRRGNKGRNQGSWEIVHGTIEPGEKPVAASLREMREETGLVPARHYNLSRVESFYRHTADEIGFIPIFVAFVDQGEVKLSDEHDAFEWLSLHAAGNRVAWPRERRGLDDIAIIFARGNAGTLEDVL